MSCFTPITISSKAKDARPGQTMRVRCGKCIGCLRDKQIEWVYRLERELPIHKHSLFVTLTYDEHNVPVKYGDTIETYETMFHKYQFTPCPDFVFSLWPEDLQRYFKRLRKSLGVSNLKYYACGEYGGSDLGCKRPHYHFLLFYDEPDNAPFVESCIRESWNKGFVTIDPVIPERITYVTKYILKNDAESAEFDEQIKPFMRVSHGVGERGFLKDYAFEYANSVDYVTLSNGAKLSQPRQFRRKFFAKEDYTSDRIQEEDYKRNKRYKDDFKIFRQNYLLEHCSASFEEVFRAYERKNDYKERKRVYDLTQRKRKNF